MKILFTGATGVVGTECIRIALQLPEVTEVVALARRPVSIPDGVAAEADKAKLKTVIVEDFGRDYSDEVKTQIKGADACIWNLAITPSKAKGMGLEELKRTSLDFTLTGLHSMLPVANADHPFRFIYTSGAMTERDQNRKDLWLIPEYRRVRGAVENAVLSEAASSQGRLESQVTKPGAVHHSHRGYFETISMHALGVVAGLPNVHISEVAAAELDQAINGIAGKDTLENADLVTVGQNALEQWGMSKGS